MKSILRIRLLPLERIVALLLAIFMAASGHAQGFTASNVPTLAQLRIGFQKSSVNLIVAKQSAVLEARFPHTKISWVEFPAGPQLLEALSVGSVDIGMTGDTPPVFAQAAGKDIIYIGAEPPKPDSSAILVPQNSPIRTLADLKGKRIALQKGSSAHYVVVKALAEAKLKWSEIEPIYLAPADARAAFERGSIDAWAIWDPYYAAVELDTNSANRPRTLHNGRGLSNNNSFYLATREFVRDHADAIRIVFDVLSQEDRKVQEDRKDSAQLIADYSGLNLATVLLFLSRRPASPVGPLQPSMIADEQHVADAFFGLGLIPQKIRINDIVWRDTQASH